MQTHCYLKSSDMIFTMTGGSASDMMLATPPQQQHLHDSSNLLPQPVQVNAQQVNAGAGLGGRSVSQSSQQLPHQSSVRKGILKHSGMGQVPHHLTGKEILR